MSELKLLNCPFCGGKATLKRDQKGDFVEWSVGCYNRGCVCSAHTYCYDNKDDAIRDWNTRTPMANIVEKLEERERYLENAMKESHENGHRFSEEKAMNERVAIRYAINIVKQGINNGLE